MRHSHLVRNATNGMRARKVLSFGSIAVFRAVCHARTSSDFAAVEIQSRSRL